jgi:serine/threonine-protein kinase
MPLSPGTRIGSYEIVGILGAGGMGEVYRARDSKLNREVALKVLPSAVAADPERLARFRREAQVLAALNHPNIAHVHGFEDSGDTHALVMELVEGPTLFDRIAQGPLALTEALPIAKQIAEAMEAAHEQGIVHRDLKPANVKVREDGTVKVLDFGLAKALGTDPSGVSGADPTNSPTLTARSTQLGMIIGTAAYMSPEQAKGRQVDRRADIWAFGVVLFEMVTGKRGYEAEDISETLAAVLTREVDWKALPSDTPARLKALVRDCLVRDPKERLRDIGDARRELQRLIEGAPEATAASGTTALPAPAWQRLLPWGIAAVAVIAAAASAMMTQKAPPSPAAVTRAQSELKKFSAFVGLSKDGSKAAYVEAGGADTTVMMLRTLDQFEAKPIAGTGGSGWPLFSPDGQWIAYSTITGTKISKIPITGGTSITLCEGNFGSGAAWSLDDRIVFAGPKGLMQVPAGGGTPTALTTVDDKKGETGHSRPQFLPGEKQLLFTLSVKDAGAGGPQFAVLDLASGAYRTVARGGANGRYVPTGHLVYLRGTTLFAVPFDLKTLSVTGAEAPVVEAVSTQGPPGTADYAVSDDGLLMYFVGEANASGTTLAWADRQGKTTRLPGQSTGLWGTGRFSPDGRFVANGISNSTGGRDIWIFDVERGTPTRVTFGEYNDFPVWTPDSKRIYFGATRNGKSGIYRAPPDGSGKAELVLETKGQPTPESVSLNESTLLYTEAADGKTSRIMVVGLVNGVASGAAKPLHDSAVGEGNPQFSPNGRWVAYVSTESGGAEIYVHAFPEAGARKRVSSDGGLKPRWSFDGRELFYWAGQPPTKLVSVDIPANDALNPSVPKTVFEGQVFGTTWDVTRDKNRFLVELTSAAGTHLATVTNWFAELVKRAPAKK